MKSRYLRFLVLPFAVAACGEDVSANHDRDRIADSGEVQHSEPTRVSTGDGLPTPKLIDLDRPANAAVSAGATTCNGIVGFLRDRDPAGRIVRAQPSAGARELGRIPAPAPSEQWGGDWPYEFDIIGSENGWLHITGARLDETMGGKPAAKVYSGTGWIASGGVHVGVQSRTGFAEPSHSAEVLISGYPDTFLDGFGPQRVVACMGRWILADWPAELASDEGRVTWHLNYRPEAVVSQNPVVLRAWVAGVCNIIETTCDGVIGDYPDTSRLEDE